MSTRIEHQIITEHGQPAFAVIPYKNFIELTKLLRDEREEILIPHEVVKAHILRGISMIRAWREHLGFTQEEVAKRAGMSQPAYAKIEKADARPKTITLKKIAEAMGIKAEQFS